MNHKIDLHETLMRHVYEMKSETNTFLVADLLTPLTRCRLTSFYLLSWTLRYIYLQQKMYSIPPRLVFHVIGFSGI